MEAVKTNIIGTHNVLTVAIECGMKKVIPLFIDQIKRRQALTFTDPNMTRFLMSLSEAVELVVFAFQHAEAGDIMVQKSPASTVGDLAQALLELFDAKNPKFHPYL